MNKLLLTLTAVFLLALPAQALAKEPQSAKVCGDGACRDVKDRSLLLPLLSGGPPGDPPRSPGPWYKAAIRVRADHGFERFTLTVVPGARLVRGEDGSWMPLTLAGRSAYARITRGLRPKPSALMPGRGDRAALDEVLGQPGGAVRPPAKPTSTATVWPWLAAAIAAAGLAASGLAVRRRRRGGGPLDQLAG